MHGKYFSMVDGIYKPTYDSGHHHVPMNIPIIIIQIGSSNWVIPVDQFSQLALLSGGFLKWENPQSSAMLIGLSITNHPFRGSSPLLWKPPETMMIVRLWKCCLAWSETLHCNRPGQSQRPSPKLLIQVFTSSSQLFPTTEAPKNATSSKISNFHQRPAGAFFSSLNQPLLDPSLESPQWPQPLQSSPSSPALELDAAQVAASAVARHKLGDLVHDTLLRYLVAPTNPNKIVISLIFYPLRTKVN